MNLRAIEGDEAVSAAVPLAGTETKPAVVGKGSGQVTNREDRRYSRTHNCNLSGPARAVQATGALDGMRARPLTKPRKRSGYYARWEREQTMASCLTVTTGMARKQTLHMRLLRNGPYSPVVGGLDRGMNRPSSGDQYVGTALSELYVLGQALCDNLIWQVRALSAPPPPA